MDFRSRTFHKNYLLVTAFVIGSFGPIFFLGTMISTSEPAAWTLDFLSWPLDGNHNYTHQSTRFLSALTGGFLFGWGITIVGLKIWVYDHAPEGVRKAILFGALAWFILDSAGSIASRNAINAIFNIPILLLAVGPYWLPARSKQ